MFKAAYTLCFWGLLRVGEITDASTHESNSHALLYTDIQIGVNGQNLVVHLRTSKTDQFGSGVTMNIPKNDKETCPVFNMREYLKVRPPLPGPLFCHFNGDPLTRYQFAVLLSRTLNVAGIKGSKYKAHSFRIGAATAFSMAGYSEEKIKEIGRWKSTAFKSYVRPSSVYVPTTLS